MSSLLHRIKVFYTAVRYVFVKRLLSLPKRHGEAFLLLTTSTSPSPTPFIFRMVQKPKHYLNLPSIRLSRDIVLPLVLFSLSTYHNFSFFFSQQAYSCPYTSRS